MEKQLRGGILVLMAVFITGTVQGAVIHIYPGDSFESAVESLNPDDELIVHEGEYNGSGRISVGVAGTESQPVIVRGAAAERRPHITRLPGDAAQNTINVEGATYITFTGLNISSNGGDCFNLNSNPHHVTIEDNICHNIDVGINWRSSMHNITVRNNHIYNTGTDGGTGEGMYVGCNWASCVVEDSLIEGNWIHDCLPGTSQGDGIEVKAGSHSNIVRDNVIYNMDYPGIFVYGGGDGINIVEGNVIWGCLEGIYAPADAVIRNNIVFNSGTGMSLYSHTQVAQMKDVVVIGNTLYNNNDDVYMRWGSVTNMTFSNNAIYNNESTALDASWNPDSAEIDAKNNFLTGSIQQGGSIDNDHFFDGGAISAAMVDPENMDFWPKVGSPLIGGANDSFVPADDFNGNTRQAPYDVGAYESDGQATNPGWTVHGGFKNSTAQSCAHDADIDCNSAVSFSEIKTYIGQWKSTSVSLSDLFVALNLWKS